MDLSELRPQMSVIQLLRRLPRLICMYLGVDNLTHHQQDEGKTSWEVRLCLQVLTEESIWVTWEVTLVQVTFSIGDSVSVLSLGSIFMTWVCQKKSFFKESDSSLFFLLVVIQMDSEITYHVEDVRGLSEAFHAVGIGQALHSAVCLVACRLWRSR